MEQLGLQVIDIYSETPKTMQKDSLGRLIFASDPDYCCYLNKTQPMDKILQANDVWINGVRGGTAAIDFPIISPSENRFEVIL